MKAIQEPYIRGYNMYSPTRTIFGCGAIKELHKQKMPGRKALVVISNGKTAYVSGGLELLKEELAQAGVEYAVYDKVQQNPTNHNVDDGVAAAKENGVDFIIGIGGGSVMDCAKGISLMFFQKHDYWYYVDHINEIEHKWLPVITITTDAGTGSESDPFICVTNEEEHVKVGLPNTKFIGTFPVIAIVDPELARTVPADYTAYQGFDALFHSVEAYISKQANYMSDMYALRAVEAVSRNLKAAVKDGNNIAAREMISLGNNLSSVVMFAGGTTSQHSLEHGIGAYFPTIPHGAGLLSFTKAYMRKIVEAHLIDERFIRLARVMGMENADKPEDFLTALENLMIACGVNDVKMSDYGMKREDIPMVVRNARRTNAGLFGNDRLEMTEERCIEIFEESYK